MYEKGVITSAEEVIFSVGFVCLSAWLTVSRITHTHTRKRKNIEKKTEKNSE